MNRYEDIKERVISVLERESTKVLAITGEWGVGKTHIVESVINDSRISLEFQESISISLIGECNHEELRRKIFYKCMLNKSERSERILDSINNKFKDISGIDLTGITMASLGRLLNNRIIVIDDIERKSDTLKIEHVFGIINEIKDSGGKVIIVSNTRELNEIDLWVKLKEKLIDREIEVNPDYQEVVIASTIGIDEQVIKNVISSVKFYKIKNIRILRILFLYAADYLSPFINAGDQYFKDLSNILTRSIVSAMGISFSEENMGFYSFKLLSSSIARASRLFTEYDVDKLFNIIFNDFKTGSYSDSDVQNVISESKLYRNYESNIESIKKSVKYINLCLDSHDENIDNEIKNIEESIKWLNICDLIEVYNSLCDLDLSEKAKYLENIWLQQPHIYHGENFVKNASENLRSETKEIIANASKFTRSKLINSFVEFDYAVDYKHEGVNYMLEINDDDFDSIIVDLNHTSLENIFLKMSNIDFNGKVEIKEKIISSLIRIMNSKEDGISKKYKNIIDHLNKIL